MSDAIDIIRSEHRNLDRVLTVLDKALADLSTAEAKPDLDLLYSIVFYIRVFPDKLHHPKEERFLFKALRRCRPDAAPVLDELEAQHVEGGRLIDRLDQALKDYDSHYPEGLDALQEAGRIYIAAQREHIGKEERDVLPLARECLGQDDWGPIHRAFATNVDPLFGDHLEAGFRALFEKITHARP